MEAGDGARRTTPPNIVRIAVSNHRIRLINRAMKFIESPIR